MQASPRVRTAAQRLVRALRASGRPHGGFDASRYFRGDERLAFLNVGSQTVRRLARDVATEHRTQWTVDDAVALADALIRDPHLEVKGAGLEVLITFRRQLRPVHLATFKRWLAGDFSANWATTDTLSCGLVAPLLIAYPALIGRLCEWSHHRNMWVRRASAVGLVPLARRGVALDAAYATVTALRADPADLIQKAVGWLLREAGKTDSVRLERYLIENGPAIARTSVRYAIERFDPDARARLLRITRAEPSPASAAPKPSAQPKSSRSKDRGFR